MESFGEGSARPQDENEGEHAGVRTPARTRGRREEWSRRAGGQEVLEDAVRDVAPEALARVLVEAEMLTRVDAADARLVCGRGEARERPLDRRRAISTACRRG